MNHEWHSNEWNKKKKKKKQTKPKNARCPFYTFRRNHLTRTESGQSQKKNEIIIVNKANWVHVA